VQKNSMPSIHTLLDSFVSPKYRIKFERKYSSMFVLLPVDLMENQTAFAPRERNNEEESQLTLSFLSSQMQHKGHTSRHAIELELRISNRHITLL